MHAPARLAASADRRAPPLSHASATAPAAEPKHDAGLYAAVVDDAAKPAPEALPLAADTRIKVVGLAKAAQYNGQPGVILGFDREAGRYMVQLKKGKELKIKRENIELVDGSIKGGFLSQVLRTGRAVCPRTRAGNAAVRKEQAWGRGRDPYPSYHTELTKEPLIFTNN